MRYDTIEQIRGAFKAHELSPLEAIAHARALITPENVEHVVEALPPAVRHRFIELAKGWMGQEQIAIGRGPALSEHPDALAAIRGWLMRHAYLPAVESRSPPGTVVPNVKRPIASRNSGTEQRGALNWRAA